MAFPDLPPPCPEVRCGPGALAELGELARGLGFRRALVASDPGIVAAGITGRAAGSLRDAGIVAEVFSGFGENPTESQVADGARSAREMNADSLIGVGGGSSLDMAKGIGFLLAGGGRMEDYRGYDRCPNPLPPLLGVPTTAGTGSEAQSYALISRDRDHQKCACGAPSAMFRAVILDPGLLPSAPRAVIAATGFDAVAHAVETAATTRRTGESAEASERAFALLSRAFRRIVAGEAGPEDWSAMQRGAFLAGAAIERSMLGAAHATANPLTRRHGIAHGRALAITLPQVVRWNGAAGPCSALLQSVRIPEGDDPPETLATLLEAWIAAAGLPTSLAAEGVPEPDLAGLAEEAGEEWTGRFNPRPFDSVGAVEIYRRCA